MNIQDFLWQENYNCWKDEVNTFGKTYFYQKRVDTVYQSYPLCNCNDKLFINIIHTDFVINDNPHISYEMSLCHENDVGEWCDLKIYSLTAEKIIGNLKMYETALLDMWNIFYWVGE